ncbi:unnamed protein product [Discula destructiva]
MQYPSHGPFQWPTMPSQALPSGQQMSSAALLATSSVPAHRSGQQQAWGRPQSRAAAQPQMNQQQQQQVAQQQLAMARAAQQQAMAQQWLNQGQPIQQTILNSQQQASNASRPTSRVVPPPGRLIDRSEYPHSHQEKRSLLMSLHQAHARSPERTRRNGDLDERYYQSVHAFAVPPFRLAYYHETTFEISPEQFSELYKQKTLPNLASANTEGQRSIPVREYGHGSLRLRVRCCRPPFVKSPVRESDWVTLDMLWPKHIFVGVNEHKLTIRRGTHNGKDLPIELTDFVVSGTNKLRVTVQRAAADQPSHYLAVEVLAVASHSALLKGLEANNRASREETLEKIRARISAAPDEDDIVLVDRTGSTARELSISLTDPFSASIFKIPARGATCSHMECFDLETWLNTRPIRQQLKCGHAKEVCTCPKRLEPTEPDKWKCPICFEDARPSSLRIDSFLEDVRRQLQEWNRMDVKSILVAVDGTWRPVDEPADDEDDEDSVADGPVAGRGISSGRKSLGPSQSASVERARAPVEVIELD